MASKPPAKPVPGKAAVPPKPAAKPAKPADSASSSTAPSTPGQLSKQSSVPSTPTLPPSAPAETTRQPSVPRASLPAALPSTPKAGTRLSVSSSATTPASTPSLTPLTTVSTPASTPALAAPPTPAAASSTTPAPSQATGKAAAATATKKHVDAKVAARTSALNAIGGVKVDVFVRVRPRLPMESSDNHCISVDRESNSILLSVEDKSQTFTYDRAYDENTSQQEIFNDAVSPIVDQVSRGMSCAVFAYGQTGAGKTYTMRGDLSDDPSKYGIIQRSIEQLFRQFQEKMYSNVSMKCTFLEIYNEELEDLFLEKPRSDLFQARKPTPHRRLVLVDDEDSGCVCQGLTEVEINDLPTVMKLLHEADARCRFAETKLNKMSNRAHRIFTMKLAFRRAEIDVKTNFTLVDLAGSEDIARSGAKGIQAREASHINKSLLTLGRVINALALNEKHIPYRDSKLTRLLSEALGGVCKTSFIACVSPSDSSRVESGSTLRYAQRAMEALNIDQLPRWKQDEIVIDSLTRRVRQLEDDLLRQAQNHRKELVKVINQRDQYRREAKRNARHLKHEQGKNRKLLARKKELKNGIVVLTGQRDLLQSEKDALREELIETRKVRDGYLNDRTTLDSVLASVRKMRELILKSHQTTEISLTNDANALLAVIKACLINLDELHDEIVRKKNISMKNEALADDFARKMASRLQNINNLSNEFQTKQDMSYTDIAKLLNDLRIARQTESSSMLTTITTFATTTTQTLKDLKQHTQAFDVSLKGMSAKRREIAQRQRIELIADLHHLQVAMVEASNQVRAHATSLDDSLAQWSAAIKLRIDESLTSSKTFVSAVAGGLASIELNLASATTAQIKKLNEHTGSLHIHADSEKKTIQQETDRVKNEIVQFVGKVLQEYSAANIQRTEAAVSGFVNKTTAIIQDTNTFAEKHKAQTVAETAKAQEWLSQTNNEATESHSQNHQQHATAIGVLNLAVQATRTGDATLVQNVDKITVLSQSHVTESDAANAEHDQAVDVATNASDALVATGIAEINKGSNTLQAKVQAYASAFESSNKTIEGKVTDSRHQVRDYVAASINNINETEGATVTYVTKELIRDLQENPPRKPYSYPTVYASTAPYDVILAASKPDWTREHNINIAAIKPGIPTDYPGQKGPEDLSGIIAKTANKPPVASEIEFIKNACRESDEEAYVSEAEDGEEEEEVVEAPLEFEEEEIPFVAHDLGEEFEAFRTVDGDPTY